MMKKRPDSLLTGTVAVVATVSALSLGAYGPDASAVDASAVPPLDTLWSETVAVMRTADGVVSLSPRRPGHDARVIGGRVAMQGHQPTVG